jgi:hypothetical protein
MKLRTLFVRVGMAVSPPCSVPSMIPSHQH